MNETLLITFVSRNGGLAQSHSRRGKQTGNTFTKTGRHFLLFAKQGFLYRPCTTTQPVNSLSIIFAFKLIFIS